MAKEKNKIKQFIRSNKSVLGKENAFSLALLRNIHFQDQLKESRPRVFLRAQNPKLN